MSGIVGLWHRDGRPMDSPVLRTMADAQRHRNRDGERRWVGHDIALLFQNNQVLPVERTGVQPAVDAAGAVVVFDGRLDERETLVQQMQRYHPVSLGFTDGELVLAAYRIWGQPFVEKLEGDFALALFDQARRVLILARDAVGVRPLYYAVRGADVILATEQKAILAYPGMPRRPNEDLLADFLLDQVQDQRMTFFQEVCSVRAGHAVVITRERVVESSYWDFDPARTIRYDSPQTYAEAFHNVFARAVRRRLQSAHPVAVSLSGGLDSSSIYCLGRTLLEESPLCPGLLGLSYVAPPGTPSDERQFLDAIEQRYAGAAITRLPARPARFFQAARQAMHWAEMPMIDEQWATTSALMDEARDRQARVLLTGHWADQFLFPQAYLVDLFRSGRWTTLVGHLREYRRWLQDANPASFYQVLAIDLAKALVPKRWHPLARRLRYRRKTQPWYSAAFHDRALARLSRRRLRTPTGSSFHAREYYDEIRNGYYALCLQWNNNVAAGHGLEMAFPFLDRDVVSFLMAIPGDELARGGVPKSLLRRAMTGILPEEIAQRRWKADFTHLVNDGIEADYDQLIALLDQGEWSVGYGFVDQRILREALRTMKRDPEWRTTSQFAWVLSQLLALEIWLQTFFANPMTRAAPDSHIEEVVHEKAG